MKFIVDEMLGKLAVWLRMLGFDAAYYHDADDSFLLRKAREEERILLTRDSSLVKVRESNAFFVSSRKLKDQICEVIEKFQLKIAPQDLLRRCSVCNEPLKNVSRREVKSKVPPLVYKLFDAFSLCPKCGKYYWKGTHYKKIVKELKDFIS